MSPPGYSGASRKGHLVFDACFESGEYLSPVCPTHEIPVIELLVLYTLIWWWQHTGSFFRSTHMSCPSWEFFCHLQCNTNPCVEIRCKQLSPRLFRYHFIIRHEFIHIRLSKFVLQGQRGKHLTRQHYIGSGIILHAINGTCEEIYAQIVYHCSDFSFFTFSISHMTWWEEFRHWLMSAELPLRSANIPASLAPDVSPAWLMELILISFQQMHY